MEHLYDKLREYAEGDDYPLHMPGHKRRTFGALPKELFSMDITEIPDFDDLHAPEGVIRSLQERVARLYGADESFVLVGGSTAGILSAISTAVPEGGRLLMARNCHKSAYHAAYLRNLNMTYLVPPVLSEFGICDGIRPEQVEEALTADPNISAVLIVSPTYEGRIAPVREIAKVVHAHGKILIVDEAHGAHLGLAGYSENSCQAGADLVIHSVHKTLPAMTQTALLHVNGDRVDRKRLRRFLRIYQSSSPSYVLMASVDNAMALIERDGRRMFEEFYENFMRMTKALGECKHLRILAVQDESQTCFGSQAATVDSARTGQEERLVFQDLGKLLIHAGDSGLTGQQIYDILREKYHLQLEMAAGEYCLAMFTVGDTKEGYERTTKALLELDHSLQRHGTTSQDGPSTARSTSVQNDCATEWTTNPVPIVHLGLREAWDAPFEEISLEDCEGRIAAEFVNLYPPGTPIVAPGEAFTKEIKEDLKRALSQGLCTRGIFDADKVRVIK
ncbi:MAG: aminotransferase class V-fold PLP-dependent enzyme [Lachnospiraceae bacterium]|nr:aminotransferase class V-fold PLP-dependent enzyme [Lachnospiraceae bacterium]